MKVLIADDDSVSLQVLKSALEDWGYQVEEATDGIEAWECLRGEDPPRLAVLDWMMPGMDGTEICREIRKQGEKPYAYLILLTAKNRREDIVQGLEAGADDFIPKPFDPSELRVRITAGQRIVNLQTELLSANEQLQFKVGECERADKEKLALIGELQEALTQLQILRGILPICGACMRIRDDQGAWQHMEAYIMAHSEAVFSHSVCPECAKKLYPDLYGD